MLYSLFVPAVKASRSNLAQVRSIVKWNCKPGWTKKMENELLKKVSGFPLKPGVYIMHDQDGNVIYVGKAKYLRKRVSSYFRHSSFASPRLRNLVGTVKDITFIRTETEAEALIVEARLIKKYKPFYNIELKMGERYPYVKITDERFPRMLITRYRDDDGATYVGPFVSAGEIRNLLRLIQRYFPLRSCNRILDGKEDSRPCINYDIGRCLAPCCSKCTEAEYRERTDDIILLLKGQSAALTERIRARMDIAARSMAFEEAARHRDAIRAIWKLNKRRISSTLSENLDMDTWEILRDLQDLLKLPVIPWRIDGFDISHTSGKETYGVAVVFEQGLPNPSLYRRFRIRDTEGVDDFRSIYEVVRRRYNRCLQGEEPMPQLALIDGGPVQLSFAMEALKDLSITDIVPVSIAKKEEKIYIPHSKEPIILSYSSEVLKLLQRVRNESHRFAITAHRTKRKRRLSRTVLQDIPGVGKHLAAALLSRFGSVSALANLSPQDLTVVKGVGPVLADKIIKFIQEGDDPPNENHS